MERGLVLDFVVKQGASVLKPDERSAGQSQTSDTSVSGAAGAEEKGHALPAQENEALLVRGDALLVLDLQGGAGRMGETREGRGQRRS